MKKIFLISLITFCLGIFIPAALAQVTIDESLRPGYAVNIPIASGAQNRAIVGNVILQLIAGSLIYAAGPIAVLMLVLGGFQYVTSHGDQNKMEGAKKTIMFAIIGLLVIIVSYAIVSNITGLFATFGQVGKDF